jgi:hypothetical protein
VFETNALVFARIRSASAYFGAHSSAHLNSSGAEWISQQSPRAQAAAGEPPELLCEVLRPGSNELEAERSAASTTLVRQIDTVRRILSTQYAPIPTQKSIRSL